MKQLGDKLVNSPICNSDACYESEFQTQGGIVKTWLCMTSGYTSNSTMTLDSEGLKQTLELTADLIKDLRQDHEPPGGGEVLAWFPTAITMPEKGMVFPEPIKMKKITKSFEIEGDENQSGETLNEEEVTKDENGNVFWGWTVVKAIPIPKDEQQKYPDPTNPGKYYKFRMDMKNLKRFDKLAFMDAAEELGMFEKPTTPVFNVNED